MVDGNESDEGLMERYAGGDGDAFEALYARHRGGVFRYFRRQCEAAIAEELFQDVWLRLVGARERYSVDARFTTYLYRIAHNRLIDHYRASGRRVEISLDDDEQGLELADHADPGPEQLAAQAETVARVYAVLDSLPDTQREAFLLREEAGLGVEEIAEVTGVGRETAKSRLRYAVSRLRRGLGGAL